MCPAGSIHPIDPGRAQPEAAADRLGVAEKLRAPLAAVHHLALLVVGTESKVLGVNIETDVKHKAPLEVGERDNHHPWFHVIRSTEVSFKVSRRRSKRDRLRANGSKISRSSVKK
jgi:hypothetical protein